MDNFICILIDDDDDDQMIFQSVINKKFAHYTFKGFYDLSSAWKTLVDVNQSVNSIVFIDLNMPKVNGKECLQKIKGTKSTQHLNVVMLSTSNNPKDINDCLLLGADAFITKPSSMEEIANEIRPYLPISQLENKNT